MDEPFQGLGNGIDGSAWYPAAAAPGGDVEGQREKVSRQTKATIDTGQGYMIGCRSLAMQAHVLETHKNE